VQRRRRRLSKGERGDPVASTKKLYLSVAVVALVIGAMGTARAGMITSFSSSAPGNTTLAVDPGNASYLDFTANFTSSTPITITVGVSGPGTYLLVAPDNAMTNNVTNSTGQRWKAFDTDIKGGYVSAFSDSSSPWSNLSFNSPFPFTNVHLSGGAGLLSGESVYLSPGFAVNGSDGRATVEVTFTPTANPEPSTLVLAGTAITLTGAGYWWRSRKRLLG
jgi:hypothetical protein